MTRLRPTTVRARLTLWYTLLLSLPLAAFAMVSYFLLANTLRSRTDAFIGDALSVFSRELVSERRIRPTLVDAIQATVHEVRFQNLDIVVFDETGAVVAMSAPLSRQERSAGGIPDSLALIGELSALAGTPRRSTLEGADGAYRLLLQPVQVGDRTFRLAGLYPLLEVDATLDRIRDLYLVAIPLLIAAAAIGGWFLAKRSLAPVSSMAARAAEIGASTLHERLPAGADDELGTLARVLNDLLDRLERSFVQQRRFMADASHELRTPAAILRTEADVSLAREHRTEAEYRESLGVVQDAARRLTRVVDDIFLLARADAGHLVLQAEPMYLEELAHDIVRAVRPLAEERGVQVTLGEVSETPMHGDADLLGRVVLNLLDNAIKHSGEGDTVSVRLTRNGTACQLMVVDSGPGIPVEARDRVFQRFFRVDAARSRAESSATSGAGLGLAIGRRIAELHGGSLELASSRPGHTEFRLVLPLTLPDAGA